MMDDYISRRALMKEFTDFVRRSNNSDFAPTPTWNDAVSLVESIPSAERRGRWILGGEEGWPKWTCSVCGGDGRGDYKICPWCGAKMEEGGE